jgi:uncharacterized MAPEG superfamily protein
MQDWLVPYELTVLAMTAVAGLFLIQLLVVDVAGIRASHKPGMPVEADPRNFLFRATRAHGNTNESIAAFVLLAVVGMLLVASAAWLNTLAWIYAGARAGHMLCYYADLRAARSTFFGIGLAALLGMFATAVWAWLR